MSKAKTLPDIMNARVRRICPNEPQLDMPDITLMTEVVEKLAGYTMKEARAVIELIGTKGPEPTIKQVMIAGAALRYDPGEEFDTFRDHVERHHRTKFEWGDAQAKEYQRLVKRAEKYYEADKGESPDR